MTRPQLESSGISGSGTKRLSLGTLAQVLVQVRAILLRPCAFEICRRRHAAGRAHRHHGAVLVATSELEERAADVSDPRHAVGVPERDGAAVDIRDLQGVSSCAWL